MAAAVRPDAELSLFRQAELGAPGRRQRCCSANRVIHAATCKSFPLLNALGRRECSVSEGKPAHAR